MRDLLAGDVLGTYQDAVSRLDLQKILELGPLPRVQILEDQIERAGDTVRLKVRLFNNAGGIGPRLIWRVNGQTQGETEPEILKGRATNGEPVVVTQALRIHPTRENIVTVTAYNGAGLLATVPVAYRIDRFGVTPAGQPRPRMFILAVGVDGYIGPALTPLIFAVKDVRTLALKLKAAAEAGGYDRVTIVGAGRGPRPHRRDRSRLRRDRGRGALPRRARRAARRPRQVGPRPLLLFRLSTRASAAGAPC